MTTAHRPTFDPARGKDAQKGPAYHQRLLPAHKTLKFRQANQGTVDENARRNLRAELLRNERKHQAQKAGIEYISDEEEPEAASVPDQKAITDTPSLHGRKRSHDETISDPTSAGDPAEGEEEESYEAKRARVLAETKDIDASSSGSDSSDSDSDSSEEEEDEEALLLAELAKIKRERAEVAAKEAAEQALRDEEQREKDIALGNPLLNGNLGAEYGVKRRWDDDVVFKNQARGTSDREKGKGKEFVNDLLRSDFHRKFMSRYVR